MSRPEHTPPATVTELLTHLDHSGPTGHKVSRLLDFYAQRLDETQRLVVAAVGLFTRPITAAQLLTLTNNETFQALAGWDEATVRTAVRGPLAGLLSWHPDQTITAHPLVRQVFRPLAFGAAQVAVDVALADTPDGAVTDRDQALRLVEAIELLLDAGQWTAADNLYIARTGDGQAWMNLPAAQLGQRAARAFVAAPQRRQACATHLSDWHMSYYLNEAGFYSMSSGDLATAVECLTSRIDHLRTGGDYVNLSIALQNWSDCLTDLGRTYEATYAADEAMTHAATSGDRTEIGDSHAYRGRVAHLAGDTAVAEHQFRLADVSQYSNDVDGDHRSSASGVWWGWFLHDTGRTAVARRLTEANLGVSQRYGWGSNVARCQLLLAHLDLTARQPATAKPHLDAALATMRAGDFLVELSYALVVAGEHDRQTTNYDNADQHLDEAINIAGPRGLTPTHSAALAERARVCADRYAGTRDTAQLFRGRDAADAALRLATGPEPLPWAELAAYRAHAHLDQAEGVDRNWAARAKALHARLVPAGLDPDPLASVEAEVARDRQQPVS